MKHALRRLLIVLFILPSLACGTVSTINTNQVEGSGKLKTQTIEVKDFDGISLESFGNVFVQQGAVEDLTVQTDDNILPWLDIRVTGGQLILGTKPNISITPSESVTYNITVRDLTKISLKGSGNISVEPLESKALDITLAGSGDIALKALQANQLSIDLLGSGNISIDKVDASAVSADVKGSGDIKLAGKVVTQKLSVSGSGNYLAGDLESESAEIRVPGSADVTVWVKETLKADIDGSGNIHYYGKPSVDQTGMGSGKINSLGEK